MDCEAVWFAWCVFLIYACDKLATSQHPPYSPDLAPSDFWLFDFIKRCLSDQPDAQSLWEAITKIVENIPRSEFLKTFRKWQERMELCIAHKCEYFEHLTQ